MALGRNIANSQSHQEYTRKFDYIFNKDYFICNQSVVISDKHLVFIKSYKDSLKIRRDCEYSINCQELYLKNKADKTLFTYKKIFGDLFFEHIYHSNGNEYLICGSDLMDFAIYNVTTNTEHKFFSICCIDSELDEDCEDEFWTINKLYYNRQNNLLAITGQDGMNHSIVSVCDFSVPDNISLLKIINLTDHLNLNYGNSYYHSSGWNENNSLEILIGKDHNKKINLTHKEITEQIFING